MPTEFDNNGARGFMPWTRHGRVAVVQLSEVSSTIYMFLPVLSAENDSILVIYLCFIAVFQLFDALSVTTSRNTARLTIPPFRDERLLSAITELLVKIPDPLTILILIYPALSDVVSWLRKTANGATG